jgi:hypothetical protein
VNPEEFVAFVQHADQTPEAGVFGFEQGVELAQAGVLDPPSVTSLLLFHQSSIL